MKNNLFNVSLTSIQESRLNTLKSYFEGYNLQDIENWLDNHPLDSLDIDNCEFNFDGDIPWMSFHASDWGFYDITSAIDTEMEKAHYKNCSKWFKTYISSKDFYAAKKLEYWFEYEDENGNAPFEDIRGWYWMTDADGDILNEKTAWKYLKGNYKDVKDYVRLMHKKEKELTFCMP